MLECENILSSSFHGIILIDAYDIPSVWLDSTTPEGLHFKFYDYFLSAKKIQTPQSLEFKPDFINADYIFQNIKIDDKKIDFDSRKLLNACPFLEKK